MRRFLLFSILALAGLAAALLLARDRVAALGLEEAFRRLGLEDADFSSVSVTPGSIRIESPRLGPDLAAERVVAGYSLAAELKIVGLQADLTHPGGAIAKLSAGGGGGGGDFSPPPVHLEKASIKGPIPNGTFTALVDGLSKRDLSAKLRVQASAEMEPAPGRPMSLRGLEADVAILPGLVGGTVEFAKGMLEDRAAAPLFAPIALSGAVRHDGGPIAFDLTAGAAGGRAPVKLTGTFDPMAAKGRAKAVLAPVVFSEGGLRLGDVAPALDVLDRFSGTVSAKADIVLTPKGADGTGEAVLGGVGLATPAATVDGLGGTIRLARLNPPETEGTQRLSARRIASAVTLDDPFVDFAFKARETGTARLSIVRAEAGFAGGRIAVRDAVIDSAKSENGLVIEFERVELGILMKLINVAGVSGQGALSGKVPILVKDGKVTIRDAVLEAREPGALAIRSEQARAALGAGGAQVALLLDVLEDFRYKRLRLAIDKPLGGETAVTLNTEGANPKVQDGRKVVLNINLSGNLDNILDTLIAGLRLSERAIGATVKGAR